MSEDELLRTSSWTVVRFIHDDTIEAVPTRWLQGDNCYWPKYDSKKLNRAIRNCEPFCNSTWDKYRIILFRNATYDDYTKARNKCRQAEETSDLNSSDPEKRRKRRPARLSSSSSEGESSNDSDRNYKKKDLAKKPASLPTFQLLANDNNNCFQNIDYEDASTKLLKKNNIYSQSDECEAITETKEANQTNKTTYNEGFKKKSQSQALPHTLTEYSSQTESVAGGSCSSSGSINLLQDKKTKEYFKQILRKLSMLELVIGDLKSEIISLKEKNKHGNEITGHDIWEEFDLPLSTRDNLVIFEQFLAIPKNMQISVDQLSKVGGGSVEEFVRRALKKLMSTNMQTEFSWLGQKQKKKFSSLNIAALISGAAFKIPNCTEKKVEDTIKNYLKRAPERLKNENKN